jgi:hypothetical protein
MTSKLFTVAGLTLHSTNDITVEKVRFGTDLIRMIKMLSNPKKINHTATGLSLAPKRVDMVELPYPMLKLEALKFLEAHPDFQSPADQALISEALFVRTPKQKRTPKTPKVKLSIDSLQSRKQMTPEQLLAIALAEESTIE